MEQVLKFINTNYSGWTFAGIEHVKGMYSRIAHSKHCGDFIIVNLRNGTTYEQFAFCEGCDSFVKFFLKDELPELLKMTYYVEPASDTESNFSSDESKYYDVEEDSQESEECDTEDDKKSSSSNCSDDCGNSDTSV